jgi:nitrite reductase/ring-hydroxylating ferredoxin subunit
LVDIAGPQLHWIDVYDDDALWDGEKVAVDADGRAVLLVRVEGRLAAYADACPHKGTSLSDGHLEDGVLTCRVHHWQFDAKSGASVNPVGKPLSCFPVRAEGGRIFVAVQSRSEY